MVRLVNNHPLLIVYSVGACTYFQYTQQPPSQLSCNPYDPFARHVWRLRMSCRVERLSGESSFDVHWLQRDINGNIIDHKRPDMIIEGADGQSERVQFGGHLINKPPSDAFLGEYWCQVVNTTTPSAPVYLGVSNSIFIENYTFYGNTSRCITTMTQNEVKCADTSPAPLRASRSTPIALATATSSQGNMIITTATQG